jgi:Sulfotransferase family
MTASADHAAAAPVSSQQRAPDFFIVGHPKCGTTALYEMLRGQPQIFMPELKEPWFFVPELRPRIRPQRFAKRPDTLEEYLALFDPARPDQQVGEATPSYLRSQTAARRIAEVQPAARIIAILREPASFLRSFHLQCVESHVETEQDLRRALALEGVRREGREIPPMCYRPEALLYSEHVRYVQQLRRYEEVFGAQRMLVLIYEDFRRDNRAALAQVLRFLGGDEMRPTDPIQANPTIRARSRKLDELSRSLSHGGGATSRAVKATVKMLTPKKLRRRAFQAAQRRVVYTEPRPPDQELMLELRRHFKGEVVALSEYLDRDLVTLWGYDGLG